MTRNKIAILMLSIVAGGFFTIIVAKELFNPTSSSSMPPSNDNTAFLAKMVDQAGGDKTKVPDNSQPTKGTGKATDTSIPSNQEGNSHPASTEDPSIRVASTFTYPESATPMTIENATPTTSAGSADVSPTSQPIDTPSLPPTGGGTQGGIPIPIGILISIGIALGVILFLAFYASPQREKE